MKDDSTSTPPPAPPPPPPALTPPAAPPAVAAAPQAQPMSESDKAKLWDLYCAHLHSHARAPHDAMAHAREQLAFFKEQTGE